MYFIIRSTSGVLDLFNITRWIRSFTIVNNNSLLVFWGDFDYVNQQSSLSLVMYDTVSDTWNTTTIAPGTHNVQRTTWKHGNIFGS